MLSQVSVILSTGGVDRGQMGRAVCMGNRTVHSNGQKIPSTTKNKWSKAGDTDLAGMHSCF